MANDAETAGSPHPPDPFSPRSGCLPSVVDAFRRRTPALRTECRSEPKIAAVETRILTGTRSTIRIVDAMSLLPTLTLGTLAFTLGCASARINRENARVLAGADARVRDGCYDCLLEAQRVYAQLADAKTTNNTRKARTRDSVSSGCSKRKSCLAFARRSSRSIREPRSSVLAPSYHDCPPRSTRTAYS